MFVIPAVDAVVANWLHPVAPALVDHALGVRARAAAELGDLERVLVPQDAIAVVQRATEL